MFDMTALELSAAIKAKKLSVTEAVSGYINLIEKNDNQYNTFITVVKEQALARAKVIQSLIDSGEKISPLAGVPVALMDNISTLGIQTSCASKMLEGYIPVFNATVVDKLEQAGLIVIGKTNMDEFAMGGSGETGSFGPVRNPRDVSRVAGGSSGGSAAAVAAGEVPLALGTDASGGITQPCCFCGVTGIKPTYGAVSRHGIIAYTSSLDQTGPIGRNIDDCAAMLSIISGPDEMDGTCVIEQPFTFNDPVDLNGVRIGLPKNYMANDIDDDVKNAVLMAAKEFEAAGAIVEECELPLMDYAVPAAYIIACAEASTNLSRYDGLKLGYRSANAKTLSEVYRFSRSEGFGLEVKRRIMAGSFALSSEYYDTFFKKALQTRELIKDAYNKLFERFSLILSPVSPTTACKLGVMPDDPVKLYRGDIYTAPVNLAGLPAVSLPCGFDNQGLSIGLQLIGSAFSENLLVSMARVYQRGTTA
ncbi:MAG: Asp-tRNA(Asn)/Glu-tRNA(Gln) amidotransferase subunit GatA [Treponema sp.]|nr:Asp-tRNA(Asn)/Glu-tRNA(Gln) amidotransferase subunit GatA [Treponema sp.]